MKNLIFQALAVIIIIGSIVTIFVSTNRLDKINNDFEEKRALAHQLCDRYTAWLDGVIQSNLNVDSADSYGPHIPLGISEEERLSIIIEEVFSPVDHKILTMWKELYDKDVTTMCIIDFYRYWGDKLKRGYIKWSGNTLYDFYGYLAYWGFWQDFLMRDLGIDLRDRSPINPNIRYEDGDLIIELRDGRTIIIDTSEKGDTKQVNILSNS